MQVTNIQSDALFILLVEKDAAFMRLAEDRFYNDYPSIIITAKGQPDVATRCAHKHRQGTDSAQLLAGSVWPDPAVCAQACCDTLLHAHQARVLCGCSCIELMQHWPMRAAARGDIPV